MKGNSVRADCTLPITVKMSKRPWCGDQNHNFRRLINCPGIIIIIIIINLEHLRIHCTANLYMFCLYNISIDICTVIIYSGKVSAFWSLLSSTPVLWECIGWRRCYRLRPRCKRVRTNQKADKVQKDVAMLKNDLEEIKEDVEMVLQVGKETDTEVKTIIEAKLAWRSGIEGCICSGGQV